MRHWLNSIFQQINFLNLLVNPKGYFQQLSARPGWSAGIIALLLTSGLFSLTGILAERNQIPMLEPPPIALEHYRLWLAALSPLVYGTGWLICTGCYYVYFRLLRQQPSFGYLMKLIGPALLLPLLVMGWPSDLALALGVFTYEMDGFPGFWLRQLLPLLLLFYMFFIQWLMIWQSFQVLLREAFAMTVLALVPTLYFWFWLLR